VSYDPVADGQLAAVVTWLELRHRRPQDVPSSPLRLRRIEKPEPAQYHELFRRVGAPWLWFSRLIMPDEKLAAIIQHDDVELYVVEDGAGRDVGMLELDFREPGECELAFVGLLPELSGKGHGRWLLGEAVRLGFRDDVRRLHVHTCSLDHPAALGAYRRAGFVPFKRAIERFPDPRLLGVLPRDCAPQIPLID
jgi:ribosomal protein S18 acetylase RimI-like enzyme